MITNKTMTLNMLLAILDLSKVFKILALIAVPVLLVMYRKQLIELAKQFRPRDTKQCPSCGEKIDVAAKKCKHCSEWIDSK